MAIATADTDPATLIRQAEALLKQAEDRYNALAEARDGHDRGNLLQQAWRARQMRRAGIVRTGLPHWFSQAGQDRFLDERVFGGRTDGFFVEVGGLDGVTGSNTVFFELFRGWDGIRVEPSATFDMMAAQRRHCRCIRAPVAGREEDAEFVQITSGYRQMSGLATTYDNDLLERVRANPEHAEERITLRTRTLASILAEAPVDRFDYVSVDVEGAELAILESFDFTAFDVTAWSVENNDGGTEVAELMAANGYDRVAWLGSDEIFVRRAP